MLSDLIWVVIAVTDASSFLRQGALFLSFKNTDMTPNTTSQPRVALTSVNGSFCLWSVSLAKSSLPASIVLNPWFNFLLNSFSCQLLKLGLIRNIWLAPASGTLAANIGIVLLASVCDIWPTGSRPRQEVGRFVVCVHFCYLTRRVTTVWCDDRFPPHGVPTPSVNSLICRCHV